MRHLLPIALLALLVGCGFKDSAIVPTTTGSTPSTGSGTGTGTGAATGTGTGTGGATGTGTGTGSGTGSGTGTGSTTTPLTVTNADLPCGYGAPGTPLANQITATSPSAGTVEVTHVDWSWGCCPDFTITAIANPATESLDATYTVHNDFCDCICALDATYTLTGVPSGTWTVRAAGATSAPVTVL